MTADELKQILMRDFPEAVVKVTGEDANYSVDMISPEFESLNRFNRQKKVLACVKDLITAGDIHAFSVQAFTQEEQNCTSNTLTVL